MSFPVTRTDMLAQGYYPRFVRNCGGCGAPLEFWKTPKGNTIPMNLMPQLDSPAVTHFADCPKAMEYRRSK